MVDRSPYDDDTAAAEPAGSRCLYLLRDDFNFVFIQIRFAIDGGGETN